MYFKAIKRSKHFERYHRATLAWSDVIRLIYAIKSKRKKKNKIEIEDERFYMLCELKDKTLYVINVKKK